MIIETFEKREEVLEEALAASRAATARVVDAGKEGAQGTLSEGRPGGGRGGLGKSVGK